MWYNRLKSNYYAISEDGVSWNRPIFNHLGENNKIQLLNFHSPSIIYDEFETDPAKRYKAIGNVKSTVSQEEIDRLKKKFKSYGWYKKSSTYWPAYSADRLDWKLYSHPAFLTGDTITLVQNPTTVEYLAFHKSSKDSRVKWRQVFLSTSKNKEDWAEPERVMMADETNHKEARLREGGTHSEIYNMSAFAYAGQWLGLITLFRRTGASKVKDPKQSGDDGPIDVRLVHSRDGKNWSRCYDRSPVIGLGPYEYDADKSVQPVYFFRDRTKQPRLFVVRLHAWSNDYSKVDGVSQLCIDNDYNYIHPNFREPNDHTEACGSPLVISDIDAAIDYAIAHANVDTNSIHIVGGSGGGYAALLCYMKIKHLVKTFTAWASITNLIDYYYECNGHRDKYEKHIHHLEQVTSWLPVDGFKPYFEKAEAEKRSPVFVNTPVEERKNSKLFIYHGIHDGCLGGYIPFTHSLKMFNKIVSDFDFTEQEILFLTNEYLNKNTII